MTALEDEHYNAAMAMSEKHRRLWVASSRETKTLRIVLTNLLKLAPRPWMDGGVSWTEWDAAMSAAEAAVQQPGNSND